MWDCNHININNVFSFTTATKVTNDFEPKTIDQCRQKAWLASRKEEIQAKLTSLATREVFGLVVHTHEDVKHVGYKWVHVRKRNKHSEITRYKAWLIAQGFL